MITQLKRIIHNKIVCVMAHGKSIEELENRIEEFRNLDVVWVSLGNFTIMEKFILSKINKKFSIIQDCSQVEHEIRYETEWRLPRIKEFLNRNENNQFITADVVIEGMYRCGALDYLSQNGIINKITIIPREEWTQVHNGMCLLLTYLAVYGAKKIVIFGMDGYVGDPKKALSSYYKPEERHEELMLAFNTLEKSGLHSDTDAFNHQFYGFYDPIRIVNGMNYIPIINCSEKSVFTLFPKQTYSQIMREFK